MAKHVCPWWMGYILANPMRKMKQNPFRIVKPYLKEGMNVLDAGCAMGFFSIPMAECVGEKGKVFCVDLQEKMLKSLEKKAKDVNLNSRMIYRKCMEESLGIKDLKEKIDFALAFAVVHEVPDQNQFLTEIYHSLKEEKKLLIAEPKGHVSKENMEKSIEIATQIGFSILEYPKIGGARAVVLVK